MGFIPYLSFYLEQISIMGLTAQKVSKSRPMNGITHVYIAGTILSIKAIILSDAFFCLLISYYTQDTAGR